MGLENFMLQVFSSGEKLQLDFSVQFFDEGNDCSYHTFEIIRTWKFVRTYFVSNYVYEMNNL